jgi:hypothetical protein
MSLIVRALLCFGITTLAFAGVAYEASSVKQTFPAATHTQTRTLDLPADTRQVAIECVCPAAT